MRIVAVREESFVLHDCLFRVCVVLLPTTQSSLCLPVAWRHAVHSHHSVWWCTPIGYGSQSVSLYDHKIWSYIYVCMSFMVQYLFVRWWELLSIFKVIYKVDFIHMAIFHCLMSQSAHLPPALWLPQNCSVVLNRLQIGDLFFVYLLIISAVSGAISWYTCPSVFLRCSELP